MAYSLLKRFVVVVIIGLSFCQVNADQPRIKIAVVAPHNSPYKSFATQVWHGAIQSAQDINRQGGILGHYLQLEYVDDACDPRKATEVAREIAADPEIVAVLGHVCSSSSLPASDIYAKAGKLMMTPSSTHTELTDKGYPTIFRLCGRDDKQGLTIANHLVRKLKSIRIALIHDKDIYGRGLVFSVKTHMAQMGVQPQLVTQIDRGQKDFRGLLQQLKEQQVDAVFFAGMHVEAGLLARTIHENHMRIPFLTGDGLATRDYLLQAGGPENTKASMMSFGPDPRQDKEIYDTLATLHNRGVEVGGYTLYAYSGIQAIAAAIEQTGIIDGSQGIQLANWLHSNPVQTILGQRSWDAKGDLTQFNFVMYVWNQRGRYEEIRDPRERHVIDNLY